MEKADKTLKAVYLVAAAAWLVFCTYSAITTDTHGVIYHIGLFLAVALLPVIFNYLIGTVFGNKEAYFGLYFLSATVALVAFFIVFPHFYQSHGFGIAALIWLCMMAVPLGLKKAVKTVRDDNPR